MLGHFSIGRRLRAPILQMAMGCMFALLFLAWSIIQNVRYHSAVTQWMPIHVQIREITGTLEDVISFGMGHQCLYRIAVPGGSLRLVKYGCSGASELEGVIPGDTVRVLVKIFPKSQYQDPGQFDFSRWLKASGEVGEAQILSRLTVIKPPTDFQRWCEFGIARLRVKLADRLLVLLQGFSQKAYLISLVTGDRSGLTPIDWWRFQSTGTNHLVAIAGLHIGFLMLWVYGLVMLVCRCVGVLSIKRPMLQGISVWSALLVGCFYADLSGAFIPAQRTVWMAFAGALLWQWRKRVSPWAVWCFAGCVMWICHPWRMYSESFWLSMGAVGCLIAGLAHRSWSHRWYDHLWRPQWILFLGLWPLTIYFFHQWSWTGVWVNLWVVPWTLLLVLPCIVLGVLLLGWASLDIKIWAVANQLVEWQMRGLDFFAHLPGAMVSVPSCSVGVCLLSLVGVGLLLLPRAVSLRLKMVGVMGVLPMMGWGSLSSFGAVRDINLPSLHGAFQMMEVGQQVWVYNAGFRGRWQSMMTYRIIPFLKAEGVAHVDTWIEAGPGSSAKAPSPSMQQFLMMPIYHVVTYVDCVKGRVWHVNGVTIQVGAGVDAGVRVGRKCQMKVIR